MNYYKIKEAFNETRNSFSYGSGSDKLASTAKLLGKSVANIGMFAVEAVMRLPEDTGKRAQDILDKHSGSMSEEQIKHAKRMIEKGNEAKERRQEKEREEYKKKDQDDYRPRGGL